MLRKVSQSQFAMRGYWMCMVRSGRRDALWDVCGQEGE